MKLIKTHNRTIFKAVLNSGHGKVPGDKIIDKDLNTTITHIATLRQR